MLPTVTSPREITIDGRRYWRWIDGLTLPVISGGDGPTDPPADPPADPPTDPPADPPTDPPADPPLGDAGKRALDAERVARRAADDRAKELEKELQQFRDANKSDTEKAIEKARQEADEAARAEVTGAYEMRLVKADVRTRAAGKLADPGDAVNFLDLDELAKSEEGPEREKAIDAAIAALVKSKPYLATGAKPGAGSADGGPRGNNASQLTREDLKGMTPEQIVEARAKGQLDGLLNRT